MRKYIDKTFSKGWYLKTRFNLSNIFQIEGMSIIVSGMKDRMINRKKNSNNYLKIDIPLLYYNLKLFKSY